MENYVLTFDNKRYKLNLERINEFCLVSGNKAGNEKEITEAYENDENGEFRLTSRINREITSPGNSQEDMIIYDFVKTMVMKLIDTNMSVMSTESHADFGFALAFNSLVAYGMLEEIKE